MAAKGAGRQELINYLEETLSKLERPPKAEMLRNTVMPQIVDSIKRLSAGAPSVVREELKSIFGTTDVLPTYSADLYQLKEALRQCAFLVKNSVQEPGANAQGGHKDDYDFAKLLSCVKKSLAQIHDPCKGHEEKMTQIVRTILQQSSAGPPEVVGVVIWAFTSKGVLPNYTASEQSFEAALRDIKAKLEPSTQLAAPQSFDESAIINLCRLSGTVLAQISVGVDTLPSQLCSMCACILRRSLVTVHLILGESEMRYGETLTAHGIDGGGVIDITVTTGTKSSLVAGVYASKWPIKVLVLRRDGQLCCDMYDEMLYRPEEMSRTGEIREMREPDWKAWGLHGENETFVKPSGSWTIDDAGRISGSGSNYVGPLQLNAEVQFDPQGGSNITLHGQETNTMVFSEDEQKVFSHQCVYRLVARLAEGPVNQKPPGYTRDMCMGGRADAGWKPSFESSWAPGRDIRMWAGFVPKAGFLSWLHLKALDPWAYHRSEGAGCFSERTDIAVWSSSADF